MSVFDIAKEVNTNKLVQNVDLSKSRRYEICGVDSCKLNALYSLLIIVIIYVIWNKVKTFHSVFYLEYVSIKSYKIIVIIMMVDDLWEKRKKMGDIFISGQAKNKGYIDSSHTII